MFGCMLSVGAEEMWVSCGEEFAMIHRSSFLDSQGGGGDLRQSQLTIRVGKHNNAIRDAVYIRTEQQKEVWVGGEEGIIVLHAEDHNVLWRYPEIDVTAMVTFLDEVFLFFFLPSFPSFPSHPFPFLFSLFVLLSHLSNYY